MEKMIIVTGIILFILLLLSGTGLNSLKNYSSYGDFEEYVLENLINNK